MCEHDDEYVHQLRWSIRHAVYADLHKHIQMLANENGVVVQPHKYPCMTISKLVQVIKDKARA